MKNAHVVAGIAVLAIVVGVLAYAAPHFTSSLRNQAAAVIGAGQVPVTVLATGNSAGEMTTRVNYLIKSPDELAALWAAVYGTTSGMPSVDFSKNDVLAVFDGSDPSGGYGISIASITEASNTRSVMITHTKPGATCMVTEALTSPFQIVSVPTTGRVTTHGDVAATTDCH